MAININELLGRKSPVKNEADKTAKKEPTFKRYQVAFNREKDADIIKLLDSVDNKTELIRYLLKEFYKYKFEKEGK